MITINKIIAHKINILENEPIYSDYLIEIPEDTKTLNFFKKHIAKNRKNGRINNCYFNNIRNNDFRDSIFKISTLQIEDDEFNEKFIEVTQWITSHYYTVAKSKSKSDGTLFFISYSLQDDTETTGTTEITETNGSYLGILKMDPNAGYQIVENQLENGKIKMAITVNPDILPSENEKLHKAAFIKLLPNYNNTETHLHAVDMQKSDDDGAKFFISDFLQSQLKANNDNLTKLVQSYLREEVIKLIDDASDKILFYNKFMDDLKNKETFNIYNELEVYVDTYIRIGSRQNTEAHIFVDRMTDKIISKYPDADLIFKPVSSRLKAKEYKSDDGNVFITLNQSNNNPTFNVSDDGKTIKIEFENRTGITTIIPK